MHLDRVTSILEAVAMAGHAISATEIHRSTGLPKPTCYRILQSLSEQGLLDSENQGGGYVIGKRLTRIAAMGQADADIRLATVPILKDAANKIGEAMFLSRYRNQGVEIIYVETPEDPKVSYIHPGYGFRPVHACSCSKAIAAFSEELFRDNVLDKPLKQYTAATKTDSTQLRKEFAQIREQGFAECVEEVELGISSVAAPILLDGVSAALSIGATASIHHFTANKRAQVGESLQHFASRISRTLAAQHLFQSTVENELGVHKSSA